MWIGAVKRLESRKEIRSDKELALESLYSD